MLPEATVVRTRFVDSHQDRYASRNTQSRCCDLVGRVPVALSRGRQDDAVQGVRISLRPPPAGPGLAATFDRTRDDCLAPRAHRHLLVDEGQRDDEQQHPLEDQARSKLPSSKGRAAASAFTYFRHSI
jgi:hypothetical protein